jgi:hypothetical protein
MVHQDHMIEHPEQIASLLRGTMNTNVDQERWIYASGVATVVQALPNEEVYWQGIGVHRWVALNLRSCSAAIETRQTLKILQTILRSGTRHIVFLNSHFFNIEDIGGMVWNG